MGEERTLMQSLAIPLNINLRDTTFAIVEDRHVALIKTTSASHKNKELEGVSNDQQKKKTMENNLEDRPKKKHLKFPRNGGEDQNMPLRDPTWTKTKN